MDTLIKCYRDGGIDQAYLVTESVSYHKASSLFYHWLPHTAHWVLHGLIHSVAVMFLNCGKAWDPIKKPTASNETEKTIWQWKQQCIYNTLFLECRMPPVPPQKEKIYGGKYNLIKSVDLHHKNNNYFLFHSLIFRLPFPGE